MNSCSALFPNVSFFYKKSLLSPHFYLAVVAPAGAGKGALGFTSILLDATQEFYDRLRREQKKEYDQKLLAWEQEQQQARDHIHDGGGEGNADLTRVDAGRNTSKSQPPPVRAGSYRALPLPAK